MPPADLALYIHWPYCARICPYCDFNVVRARPGKDGGRTDEQVALAEAILADLDAQAALIGPRRLASLFFGGGTPSLMDPQTVAAVIARARHHFGEHPVEITLEANPTDAEAARFSALADAGINRLSLGVQSLDDDALKALGRNHDAAEARRAARLAAAAFPRLSIDLIYARPGQTVAAWTDELNTALNWGFEHISPYQLTIEPTTAFGRAFARGSLIPPDDDRAADLYEATQTTLEAAGFDAYEVSNHARGTTAQSAHNLHVWRGGDYLGLGPGAHGRLTLDGTRTATVAHRRIADYIEGVATAQPWSEQDALSPHDAAEECVLLALRTTEGAAPDALAQLGLTSDAPPVRDLIADSFLTLTPAGHLAATASGRPLLDSILKALLT